MDTVRFTYNGPDNPCEGADMDVSVCLRTEFPTLPRLADLFTAFLTNCGYTYVRGVTIHTGTEDGAVCDVTSSI